MERLLTTEEVAELLRIDPVTVRRLVTRGELAASRIAGEYRFTPASVESFVENQRVVVNRAPARTLVGPEAAPILADVLARIKPVPLAPGSERRGDRFTKRARTVLTLAQGEATAYNHGGIGTEHLLLGIMEEGEGVGAEALRRLQVQPRAVREQIETLHPAGEQPEGDQRGLLPDFKASLPLAIEEAGSLGHQHAGTGHLLLGLLREGAGIASQVLVQSGVTLEQARELVMQLHADEDELAAD